MKTTMKKNFFKEMGDIPDIDLEDLDLLNNGSTSKQRGERTLKYEEKFKNATELEDNKVLTEKEGIYKVKKPIEVHKKIICYKYIFDIRGLGKTNKISEHEFIASGIIPEGAYVVRPKDGILSSIRTNVFKINKMIDEGKEGKPYTFKEYDNYRPGFIRCYSDYNARFGYQLGKRHFEPTLDPDLTKTNTSGVHVYLKKEDAKKYTIQWDGYGKKKEQFMTWWMLE